MNHYENYEYVKNQINEFRQAVALLHDELLKFGTNVTRIMDKLEKEKKNDSEKV